jgi:hypothetical protein
MELFNLTRKSKLPRIHSSDILPLAFAGLSVGAMMLSLLFLKEATSLSNSFTEKRAAHTENPT